MWRIIGFTPDKSRDQSGEVKQIISWLQAGEMDFFHIRKPKFGAKETKRYLELFPLELRERLCLHDHYEIAEEMGVGGININHRNADKNISLWNGRLSYSCHSLESVAAHIDRADYVFLSPVFDSRSKHNYKSPFTLSDLQTAAERGLINEKVIAMGGVTKGRFDILKQLNFGGGALLGALWTK
ncbi:MAG: thiamine phosphate synthase [Bacteroidales bacterium]|jgi:thiamine monophosphate synthase|nr:thiamine phosphate synthase [Bacteroidales bacterium]